MTPQIENAAVLSDQNVKTYRELSLTRLMTITEDLHQCKDSPDLGNWPSKKKTIHTQNTKLKKKDTQNYPNKCLTSYWFQ